MKQVILSALLALLIFLPARAQNVFSDSLQVSLLTCSSGPDAYERFGHTGLRILDLRQPEMDITFDYGVFSFDAPHFIYRFVKGETDYQLGARSTRDFIASYNRRGLGMTERVLRLDSAQCQDMVKRLLVNYLPENRTYRYSFFFDNCATRPYHLINDVTGHTISYDSTWVNSLTLRQMVQQKTGTDNWLDFGIALSVAQRADIYASYEEQMFLPSYLEGAVDHASIPVEFSEKTVMLPLVTEGRTLLNMTPGAAEAISAEDAVKPNSAFAIALLIGLLFAALEHRERSKAKGQKTWQTMGCAYDTLFFALLGITGCIVWFLNFCSLHPAVDHNINCLWLLPTHVIMAVLIWIKRLRKVSRIYFGITFALVIVYVVTDWIVGQYCPPAFLLLLAITLLRSYCRMKARS